MSDDFTWQSAPSSQKSGLSLRLIVILICAVIGLAAGSLFPIKMVMNVLERASLPRVTAKGNVAATSAQDASRAVLTPQAEVPSPEMERPPAATPKRIVLLNPGSADSKAAPEELPLGVPSGEPSAAQPKGPHRQSPALSARGDRNVLVVVRRRGPPYDTKILRGRIHDGRLIVKAPGIPLR